MFRINRQRQSVIRTWNDLTFTSVFCSQKPTALTLSDISSEIWTYLLHNLKQSYTEKTNSQNNDDKVKTLTLGSHSVSVNYCNILVYFCVMNNKVKSALIVLSTKWSDKSCRYHEKDDNIRYWPQVILKLMHQLSPLPIRLHDDKVHIVKSKRYNARIFSYAEIYTKSFGYEEI